MVFYIFKGYTWNKISSLACLKAKIEEKNNFSFVLIKTRFVHFWKIKKNNKQISHFYFLR